MDNYKARVFPRPRGCHTRVQELGLDGQLSNAVQSNVKSGEISPYRAYAASTLVPEQLPPPLDSASYEIGQSVQPVGPGPGGMVGRGREMVPGESGQAAGTVVAAVPTTVRASPAPSLSAMWVLQRGERTGAIPQRRR